MTMSNGAGLQGSASEESPKSRLASGYLAAVVGGPLLMLLSAFFIVPTQWFNMHSHNTYLANSGYAAGLSGQECQVLIYGDSTAMVAVDPATIYERTGLTACNIAEFAGMTLVNQTLLVDTFLRHNPRPRFLVFMFSPVNMAEPYAWKRATLFEAISFRLRQEPNFKTVRLLASHPLETLTWAEQGMRLTLLNAGTRPFEPETAHVANRLAEDSD